MNYNFSNKRALVRVDFNVPLDGNYKVTDESRILAALPTIRKIINDGGSVVLMSHLGRPKDGPSEKFSLKHLVPVLNKHLGQEVKFAADCMGSEVLALALSLKKGEVLLLENLRFYKEEEKGDRAFAEKLAKMGEVYVNDAFGTAHRAHASTAIIAEFFGKEKLFGFCMEGELKSINKVLNESEKPFTAVIGGAKVSDKILILEQLLRKANHIVIGGGMSFTFIRALGGQTGNSLVEEDRIEKAKEILEKARIAGVKIHLPSDAVIADKFDNEANRKICQTAKIDEGWMGLDIGPDSIAEFHKVIALSKTILWNGPMGVFEMSNFEKGTRSMAHSIAEATDKGSFSLIGGGDSVAAINKFNLASRVSYVSTGGGALLEYIESGSLPGVDAVMN